jgi:iron complex transport system substrate-binding protein
MLKFWHNNTSYPTMGAGNRLGFLLGPESVFTHQTIFAGSVLSKYWILFSLVISMGCENQGNQQSKNSQKKRKEFQTVIGISPALTEMLFALIPEKNVAGVTKQCNYPADKIKKKQRLETYPMDFEKLLEMKPDLVVTEKGISSIQDIQKMQNLGLHVIEFQYHNTRDILNAMEKLMKMLPILPEAKSLHDSLTRALNTQEEKYKHQTRQERPSVLVITWIDPIFAYGFETWMTDKIRLAGGRNVLEEKLDKPYPTLSRETILDLNPDILFGGTFEQMDTSFFRLYPELRTISAYRNKCIFALNDDLATRPGPRFMEGIQELEKCINDFKRIPVHVQKSKQLTF